MDCAHHDAGRCRSCFLLPLGRNEQVARKEAHCRALLGDGPTWLPTVVGAETGFRNKAKMVVAGTVTSPTLGILGPDGAGVDLRDCGLHAAPIQVALPVLADFVRAARLTPYDVPTRRGELKHVLVTASPDSELMVRFVLRSTESLPRIRKHLPGLHDALPGLRVVSVNVQPEHKAVLDGPEEIVLSEAVSLPMRLGERTLHLRPRSFFQTNTDVAVALYGQAAAWVEEIAPRSVLDLYCGVGGFALHLAGRGREVHGTELTPEAVSSARQSVREAGLENISFSVGDAAEEPLDDRDLVLVNPPRRGLGVELARRLEASAVRHVLYSSCRAETLARDLTDMPSLRPRRAVLFDMFPHTDHYEVLVLLTRD